MFFRFPSSAYRSADLKVQIGAFILAGWLFLTSAVASAAPSAPSLTKEITLQNGAVMIYEKNVAIPTRDGSVVYGNVFRPKTPGHYPVVMAQSAYGKDEPFGEGYPGPWAQLMQHHPEVCSKSSCKYIRFEHTDPERWIGDGYVIMMVDVRGAGYSPGVLNMLSPKETQDYFDVIEWAAKQAWSNGKIGLLGTSYMAINQWQVAALRPPHLAAIAPFEGTSDLYREDEFNGGIFSDVWLDTWFHRQILPAQNGNAKTRYVDPDFGGAPTGAPLDEKALEQNRVSMLDTLRDHPLLDATNRAFNAKLENIVVPMLSAGDVQGPALHGRGNYEAFVRVSSHQKWLPLHMGNWEYYYSDEGLALQQKFFDHFLKGIDNGWEKTPLVLLPVRDEHNKPYAVRAEQEWPLKRTRFTPFYLDAATNTLQSAPVPEGAKASFQAGQSQLTFTMPINEEVEITGPMAAHLWVASSTTDADLYLTLQMFDEQGKEITYLTASGPETPFAQGWLKVSRRKLDPILTKPYQPVQAHDEEQKLTAGRLYPVDVEIWPSTLVAHPGYKLVMTLAGADFTRPTVKWSFLHHEDLKSAEFHGTTTLATGRGRQSSLLLPIIPRATP